MVPHSSTPGSGAARPLSESTTAALTAAVRRAVGQPPPPLDDGAAPAVDRDRALRDAVAAVVAEARERKMRPEELLTAFKSVLDAIPEAQSGVLGRVEESRLRERLVTLCIKAYYER
ncbi:MAG TPA: hypothetical protein VFJ74_04845 [Gemmatimonadaceae bacterium]|nr:hypothetical protein [Gemmatimonadaceae bacterium]